IQSLPRRGAAVFACVLQIPQLPSIHTLSFLPFSPEPTRMSFLMFLRNLLERRRGPSRRPGARRRGSLPRQPYRPVLEILEDRLPPGTLMNGGLGDPLGLSPFDESATVTRNNTAPPPGSTGSSPTSSPSSPTTPNDPTTTTSSSTTPSVPTPSNTPSTNSG